LSAIRAEELAFQMEWAAEEAQFEAETGEIERKYWEQHQFPVVYDDDFDWEHNDF
jgi:hypothetical protein